MNPADLLLADLLAGVEQLSQASIDGWLLAVAVSLGIVTLRTVLRLVL